MTMKEEISNKTLAVLVGVAVVVAVLGLFSGAPASLTGLALVDNVTSYAAANVVGDVQLTAHVDAIFLGDLLPDDTNSSDEADDNLTIGNTGRAVVDVAYWANDSIWEYNCDNTDTPQGDSADSCFEMILYTNDSGAVLGSYDTAYQDIVIGYGSAFTLVTDLDTGDNITLGINVTVPHYERATVANTSIWFEGTEA
jgi:hypothetical protein